MSRVIRFRAWDGTEMYTPIIGQDGRIFRNDRDYEDNDYALYDELMQYTGLIDRNGVEIYEGDIVREHHGGLAYEDHFYQSKLVEWDAFGYQPFMRMIGGAAHDYANNLKEYVVIGNIYENPELLKEEA